MFEDVVNHVKAEHRFLKVLQAFLEGHIISVGDSEYRYADIDHELYKKPASDGGTMVMCASVSGLFKRNFIFNSSSPVESCIHGNSPIPDSANGFLWMLYTENAIHGIKSLYRSMSDQEVSIAISNLSFDHIQNNRQ